MQANSRVKAALALTGIVIAVVEVGVGLPLHLGSFLGVEISDTALTVITFGVIPAFLIQVFIVGTFSQYYQSSKQWADLRKQYGWLQWLWSRTYWEEHSKHSSPHAPAWLRRVRTVGTLYTLTIFLMSLIVVPFDTSHLFLISAFDRWVTSGSNLFLSTMMLYLALNELPMLVSIWRESRMQSEQIPQA